MRPNSALRPLGSRRRGRRWARGGAGGSGGVFSSARALLGVLPGNRGGGKFRRGSVRKLWLRSQHNLRTGRWEGICYPSIRRIGAAGFTAETYQYPVTFL